MTTVSVPVKEKRKRRAPSEPLPQQQPRYQVILWDDDDHSYMYVMNLLRALFGIPLEKGYVMARTVDETGRAICLVTTREHAELKQQQIHAFGKDPQIARCAGSMTATIEPVSM